MPEAHGPELGSDMASPATTQDPTVGGSTPVDTTPHATNFSMLTHRPDAYSDEFGPNHQAEFGSDLTSPATTQEPTVGRYAPVPTTPHGMHFSMPTQQPTPRGQGGVDTAAYETPQHSSYGGNNPATSRSFTNGHVTGSNGNTAQGRRNQTLGNGFSTGPPFSSPGPIGYNTGRCSAQESTIAPSGFGANGGLGSGYVVGPSSMNQTDDNLLGTGLQSGMPGSAAVLPTFHHHGRSVHGASTNKNSYGSMDPSNKTSAPRKPLRRPRSPTESDKESGIYHSRKRAKTLSAAKNGEAKPWPPEAQALSDMIVERVNKYRELPGAHIGWTKMWNDFKQYVPGIAEGKAAPWYWDVDAIEIEYIRREAEAGRTDFVPSKKPPSTSTKRSIAAARKKRGSPSTTEQRRA